MTGMPAFLQWRASIPFRVELYTLVVPAKMGSSSGMNITVRLSRQSGVARATCPD